MAAKAAVSAPASLHDVALDMAQAAHGRELWHSIGCVACHGAFAAPAVAFGDATLSTDLPLAAVPAPFGERSGKWRIGELAAFLRDPVAVRTHGRMPSFGLNEPDSLALAHYLVSQFGPPPEASGTSTASGPESVRAPVDVAPVDMATIERGKQRFNELGCAACHRLSAVFEPRRPDGMKALLDLDSTRGCLAATSEQRGAAPRFDLTSTQHAALDAALASLIEIARAGGAPAPLERARDLVAVMRCGSCHEQNGGGVRSEWRGYFRSRVEADLGDEGRLPPRLDGVGARLQSPWMERVIGHGERARPYLAARMPSFGDALATELTSGLAAAEGCRRSDDSSVATRSSEPGSASSSDSSVEARSVIGRRLAGSGGMNCITCHSFGDRPIKRFL